MTPSAIPRGMIETLRTGSASGGEHPHERVSRLVVGRPLPVLGLEHDPARRAEQDLLERVGEVRHLDLVVLAAGGEQRRLVGEVGQVGAHHPGRRRRQGLEIDVVGQRQRPGVDLEDLAAPGPCPAAAPRLGGRSAPGGAGQGRGSPAGWWRRCTTTACVDSKPSISVRIWSSVCSRSSLAPVMPAEPWRERPIGVELVDEDDRRRGLLGLGEQVAHARRADPDDRLDELGGRDREEGRLRLAGHRTREQRLARPGRPVEEHAVGYPRAEAHVPVRAS